ncbi:lipid kinase [Schlesneria sp. DSM 10557]|uniref:lipid kinase n=1 Tax=Schlesneria sp. DSM 10557 TaxID=3044399 RepID=UPI00359F2B22
MKSRALLLGNCNSRNGASAFDAAAKELSQNGIELIRESPPDVDQLVSLIRQHRHDVDQIIIVGGDGTLNAALDGLVECSVPLGIVPSGTANDLARTLGIPTDTAAACQVILEGQMHPIDVGWVNGKHYFNVASLGVSVKVTEQLSKRSKSRWGILAYLLTAARVIVASRPFTASIRSEMESIQVRTIQIAVGNGRYYGGGLTIADDASIVDNRLDFYSLEIQRWWQIIPLLMAMYRGDLSRSPHARTLRGTEFTIETSRPRKLNTDGEITTQTPAEFRVLSQAVRVFVPNGVIAESKS